MSHYGYGEEPDNPGVHELSAKSNEQEQIGRRLERERELRFR